MKIILSQMIYSITVCFQAMLDMDFKTGLFQASVRGHWHKIFWERQETFISKNTFYAIVTTTTFSQSERMTKQISECWLNTSPARSESFLKADVFKQSF